MKTTSIIILLIAVVVLGLLLFDERQSKDYELRAKDGRYKASIDSLQDAYDEIIRTKDSAAYYAFKNAMEGANRTEGELIRTKQLLKDEIARKRVFTDHQVDSLLSLVQ